MPLGIQIQHVRVAICCVRVTPGRLFVKYRAAIGHFVIGKIGVGTEIVVIRSSRRTIQSIRTAVADLSSGKAVVENLAGMKFGTQHVEVHVVRRISIVFFPLEPATCQRGHTNIARKGDAVHIVIGDEALVFTETISLDTGSHLPVAVWHLQFSVGIFCFNANAIGAELSAVVTLAAPGLTPGRIELAVPDQAHVIVEVPGDLCTQALINKGIAAITGRAKLFSTRGQILCF